MAANQLRSEANQAILKLEGVVDSGRGGFRMGKRVFIRMSTEPGSLAYGFKLSVADSKIFVEKYECIQPMKFGGMGKKGWVELTLTRRNQIPLLLRALRKSYGLYV